MEINSFVRSETEVDQLENLLSHDIRLPRYYLIYGGPNSGKTTFARILRRKGGRYINTDMLRNYFDIPLNTYLILDAEEEELMRVLQRGNFELRFRRFEQRLRAANTILIIFSPTDLSQSLDSTRALYTEKIHFPFDFSRTLV